MNDWTTAAAAAESKPHSPSVTTCSTDCSLMMHSSYVACSSPYVAWRSEDHIHCNSVNSWFDDRPESHICEKAAWRGGSSVRADKERLLLDLGCNCDTRLHFPRSRIPSNCITKLAGCPLPASQQVSHQLPISDDDRLDLTRVNCYRTEDHSCW